MKNPNKIFIIWGVIVLVIVILLTILGFMLKDVDNEYSKVEDKLEERAKKYVDAKFLYPDEGKVVRVTKKELVENDFLDNLDLDDDTCDGYVEVRLDGVYKYETYIKCDKYTTKGFSN